MVGATRRRGEGEVITSQPSEKDAADAGCGRRKFFCGRKGKFGLNCQAVSDVRGRILDLSIG